MRKYTTHMSEEKAISIASAILSSFIALAIIVA